MNRQRSGIIGIGIVVLLGVLVVWMELGGARGGLFSVMGEEEARVRVYIHAPEVGVEGVAYWAGVFRGRGLSGSVRERILADELAGHDVLLLGSDSRHLDVEQRGVVADFVARGGGVIV